MQKYQRINYSFLNQIFAYFSEIEISLFPIIIHYLKGYKQVSEQNKKCSMFINITD